LLDTATVEIAIRKSLKEKEEGSTLTIFGFRISGDRALDQRIRESATSDPLKYKGDFSKLSVGADFLKGK
jgi:hypothetical protein